MQLLWPLAVGHALQASAKGRIPAWSRKESAHQSAIVEASATDENGQTAATRDSADRRAGFARVARCGIFLQRVRNVDEVVRNPATLFERDLVGADVEAAING